MKKFIKLMAFFAVVSSLVVIQSCDEEDPPIPPTLTGPASVASVQVGTKADVTFTFRADEGFRTATVSATGGTATVKTNGTEGATEGNIVVEFTADNTAGAAVVTLTISDLKDQSVSATGTLNKTISAPPAVTLSAASGSANPGATVSVTVTTTAANGAKNLSYTTTGGLTGSPASPITISGTSAVNSVITFTVPASATVGAVLTAVFTAQDNQNLNSTAATFTVTVADPTNVLTGDVTAPTTLNKGVPYLVRNQYRVKSGVTLTVQPGAIIKGDKATKGVIIIEPGGRLVANGSPAEPIVFTSSQPINERDRGDWGGIVWLGNAYVNQSASPAVEGITPPTTYGTASQTDATVGTNAQDNGSLRYARIEYAGIELTPNNETNSLTMGGLGSATVVEYVQTSYGGDDAFEWFGGTVNGRYLVSLSTWDDDFDTDFGWRGNVQYGLVIRNPFFADQSGSTAFESDNQANANPIDVCNDAVKTGCTQGVFSNITVLGPRDFSRAISGNYTRALHIRRRSAISIFNSFISGFNTGLTIDDAGTEGNYNATNSGFGRLANNVLLASLLPNVPATISTNTTAVTTIGNATGNVLFGSTTAQNIWRGSGAGNVDQVPAFVSRWVRDANNGTIIGQAIINTWSSTPSTIEAAPATPTAANPGIAYAGNAGVASTTGGSAITGDISIVNPYSAYGIDRNAFFGANTAATYPANPNFALSASGTLAAGAVFTDAKLGSFFTAPSSPAFRGAFGSTDWTDGWCEFVPVTKVY